MFAEFGGLGSCCVAGLQAEDVASHEVVPFDDLLECVVISAVGWEGIGVEESSEGISSLISTMRVHLASSVIRLDVNKGLVNPAHDLNIRRGLHELNTGERSGRDDACPPPRLGAPRHSLALCISNNSIRLRRAPDTKVVDRVDDCCLAF